MRDDDHRHPLVRELLDEGEHLADHLRVERGGRLIEEHDLRIHCKRAHDGDALALAAGQGGRIHLCLIGEADARQQLHGARLRLLFDLLFAPDLHLRSSVLLFRIAFFMKNLPEAGAADVLHSDVDGRERDIVEHVHVIEQVELLEHHAHAATLEVDVHLQVAQVIALKEDVTVRRVLEHVQAAQKSALAAARRANDGDLFAGVHLFGNIVEDDEIAVALGQVLHLDEGVRVDRLDGRLLRLGEFGFLNLRPRLFGGGQRFSAFHSCATSFRLSG